MLDQIHQPEVCLYVCVCACVCGCGSEHENSNTQQDRGTQFCSMDLSEKATSSSRLNNFKIYRPHYATGTDDDVAGNRKNL